ncbi:hypothetical protein K505DRAFT_328304 [Melanomma pulvis-pyrius CBS 109.77]|uniref:Uncharacterized protein n=1 Tax=Melanomma pulvis-pyrius CBS 109.77 TaxID=1314802 RepID=A0A6A6WZI5_9PLEO|nr:hypothetical protein K505DRAFT_328304 [Melanomma pulvis-pyrius CBS 109.77]
MIDNPIPPQTLFQLTPQCPGTSTSIPQDIPWPDALHETHHLSVPTDHNTANPPRPKRTTRLSSASMSPPQPVSENETWMPSNFPQQDPRSVVLDTDPSALPMDSVANAIAESLVNRSCLGNSAQYQCWNGQTRKPGRGGVQPED